MIKVCVVKNKTHAYGAIFENKQEADNWIEVQEKKGNWGKPEDYEIKIIDLETDEQTRKARIKEMKKKRDSILCATDWLLLPDVKVDQKHRKMYIEYRQVLRDLPQKLKPNSSTHIEDFAKWVRRKHPEEFMDGGNGQKIIQRFKYYIEEK